MFNDPDKLQGEQPHSGPLPEMMRPREMSDIAGQEEFWAPGRPLWQMVLSGRISALIFWGPPGTGKTSLARVIAATLGQPVAMLSAVTHGVKDIRASIEQSQEHRRFTGRPHLMFMDEIHRLSRSQQDVLLPALESGDVWFIGATTENPSFEVNNAILSRALTFRFSKLSRAATRALLDRALLSSHVRRTDVAPEVLDIIAASADGDGRRALNLLDAVLVAAPVEVSPITADSVRGLADSLNLYYDHASEHHYDTISAFIKSIRASQPDAAVYYLARMLEGGEDPVFIGRRLIIAASEDVGNANPTALLVALAATQAVHMTGMPEARIMLAQATTYLASSPKSNRAYMAVESALEDVREHGGLEIPMFLRNAPTRFMKEAGYGREYIYAHDDQAGAAAQSCLPRELSGKKYYEPSAHGAEAALAKHLEALKAEASRRGGRRDA